MRKAYSGFRFAEWMWMIWGKHLFPDLSCQVKTSLN